MDYKAFAQTFWQQGYLLIEDFFEPVLMDEYERLIVDHFGLDPDYLHNPEFLQKSATEVIPWFPQQEGITAFDVVANDDRLQQLTDAVLGEGWQSLYCMTMFSKQGSSGQAWHQDCAPEDPREFNLNRLCYSGNIDRQTGGQTLVVPGSHLLGEIPVGPGDEDFDGQSVLSPSKGSLVLLHGHTWHRVTPVTGKYRSSTNYRSMPKGTPQDITDIAVYRNIRYRFSTNEVVENRLLS
jgi:ectoine hydroxylase